MKALITGGAGFVGSHLSEHLLSIGHQVTVVDDLSTGSSQNIEHLFSNKRFKSVTGSVLQTQFVEPLVAECDVIYHLAASVGVKLIVDEPVKTIETNIRGTEIMLYLADKRKKKILITSTSEVYGKNQKSPFSEDDDMVLGAT